MALLTRHRVRRLDRGEQLDNPISGCNAPFLGRNDKGRPTTAAGLVDVCPSVQQQLHNIEVPFFGHHDIFRCAVVARSLVDGRPSEQELAASCTSPFAAATDSNERLFLSEDFASREIGSFH